MRGQIITMDQIFLEKKMMMKNQSKPKDKEINNLWYLLDKVKDGKYLREDEIRELQRLERKFHNVKATRSDILGATKSARYGAVLDI